MYVTAAMTPGVRSVRPFLSTFQTKKGDRKTRLAMTSIQKAEIGKPLGTDADQDRENPVHDHGTEHPQHGLSQVQPEQVCRASSRNDEQGADDTDPGTQRLDQAEPIAEQDKASRHHDRGHGGLQHRNRWHGTSSE